VIFLFKVQDLQVQVVDLLTYLVVIVLVVKFNKKPVTEPPLELTIATVQQQLLQRDLGLVTLRQYRLPTLHIIATPLLATWLIQLLIAATPLLV
jgi:hypothetical protein